MRYFVNASERELGMTFRWEREGVEEKGYHVLGKRVVAVDPRYFCYTELETMLGYTRKAKEKLDGPRKSPSRNE